MAQYQLYGFGRDLCVVQHRSAGVAAVVRMMALQQLTALPVMVAQPVVVQHRLSVLFAHAKVFVVRFVPFLNYRHNFVGYRDDPVLSCRRFHAACHVLLFYEYIFCFNL